jgi:hypothetical protein
MFITGVITGQDQGQKVTRQTAVKAFSEKKFDLAYRQFTELSATYPGDPLYKYYCGACLVETGKDPLKATALLNTAANNSGAIITVPADCFFYLGRANQMSGKYQEAIQAYNRFTDQAGKKAAKDLDVPGFIKQCNDGKGKIISDEVTEPESKKADSAAVKIIVPANSNGLIVNKAGQVNKRDSLPGEYDKQLAAVLEARIKEDSVALLKGKQQIKPAVKTEQKDTTKVITAPVVIAKPLTETKTTDKADGAGKQTAIYSEFSVGGKTAVKPDEKVIIDPEVPAGLIYRIQVAVFRNPVTYAYFKGIAPVQGFKNPANGISTYYAGRFRKADDAGKSLQKVRSLGFRDAFVVALMDKKAVSTDRAAALEKEWGSKPLFITGVPADTVRDTVPPTLVFRVEVRRTQKPLPADQVDALRKLAGGRGFDIVTPEPKQYIYLVGSFFSYTSATEYADLLLRNGYKEAKVAAWLGKREIPVETAKQLFDQQ